MKLTSRLLLAALCLAAPAAHGAVLSYTSAYRYVEGGSQTFQSIDPFGLFDESVAGLDSMATHRSSLGTTAILLASRITGQSERGAAFFKVDFVLDEAAAWSLTGSFELLGRDGIACVSLQDLAHRDTTIVNEIIFAPQLDLETRSLQFGGVLAAGSYSLEAMIYGGGDNQMARASIDAVFTIPEPGASLLSVVALMLAARRRR